MHDQRMAFVEDFVKTDQGTTGRPHSTCTCGWRTTQRDGKRVLQLDTYGSPTRQDLGTVSQSLQLDENGARQLIAIIRTVFPDA